MRTNFDIYVFILELAIILEKNAGMYYQKYASMLEKNEWTCTTRMGEYVRIE